MVVGHAVEKVRGVPGVGCPHLVPYGVPVTGPRRTDGLTGYGGWPAPVCCPCLGDGARGWLEGGGGVRWVECLEADGGVQGPSEVVHQGFVAYGESLGGRGSISWEAGPGVTATWEGGWCRLGWWSGLPPSGWWFAGHAWGVLMAVGWAPWQTL